MRCTPVLASAIAVIASVSTAEAVEGPAAAGPIGGTDIRSALHPPPGIYVGAIGFVAETSAFVGGDGKRIPGIEDAYLEKQLAAPFLIYVPPVKVLGGSVSMGGILPMGNQCGKLFANTSERCTTALGDLYLEANWARFFGTVRPSSYSNAYPIPDGLSLLVGFGVVLPTGQFDSSDPREQVISIGNNTWDFAPTIALTYTTPAIIAEGTELSAKVYLNSYLENEETNYHSGDVLNVDFALTEHIGPFQVGFAGYYARQIEDDELAGIPVAPNGRRGELLQIGGVVNYDIPTANASLRVKANTSAIAEHTVEYSALVFGWIKKF